MNKESCRTEGKEKEMIYSVAVAYYEDNTSSMGEIVTTYIVEVYYSPTESYSLNKRYSDFSSLYICHKDVLPPTYRFPNKSIFNNNAQFTKERRLRGFDELLKRLLKIDPNSVELQSFLEVPDRISLFIANDNFAVAPKRGTKTLKRNSADKVVGTLDSINDDDEDSDGHESDCEENDGLDKSFDEDNDIQFFNQLNETVKKDFLYILRSSFRSATAVYGVLIVIRIIDISKTTYGKMVLTWIALGLLLTYGRIILYKMKATRSRKLKFE